MALNTTSDILTEFLVRNNRTTTDGFITDSTLQGWLKDAHTWAAAYKKWPMTEGRYSTTSTSATSSEEGWTRISYPEGLKADSVRRLSVGGKRYYKKNFYKFAEFIEDNPQDSSKIFTDYARNLYINPMAGDFSGTVAMYGQYTPILDVTDMTSKTIFSDYDEQGNEALVTMMTSYLKDREHLPDEMVLKEQQAGKQLDKVQGLIDEEQFAYQDTNNQGMWKRFDVMRGGFKEDLFSRDQWSNW